MAAHQRFNIKDLAMLKEEARRLMIDIPVNEDTSVLFDKVVLMDGRELTNRFAVHPMEGFDADADGAPGKLTFRRYRRYAAGGAGLIWGEACAVVPEGRSNPHQLYIHSRNWTNFRELTEAFRKQAAEAGNARPLLILQLTHSGRYSQPEGRPAPLIAHHSPPIDAKQNLPADNPLVTDDYLEQLQEKFLEAADLAARAGFDGVDIKSCHGYLVSELLACFTREQSRYGGSFENRTRFLREVTEKVTKQIPGLLVTTRLNACDALPYPYGFGVSPEDTISPDLTETFSLIETLCGTGMPLISISLGNPYYAPHYSRPADLPVKDSSQPDMHPLENIAGMLGITRDIQTRFKALPVIGSGYSWLRQFLPHVGAGVVASGWASIIGQGRNSFAYPDSVRELKEKGKFDADKVCIGCSCCTQLMRDGGSTGCVIRDKEIYAALYREVCRKR